MYNLNLDAVNTVLRTLIRTLLGMPSNSIRPANQGAPVGLLPDQWATVLLLPLSGEGWDAARYVDDPSPALTTNEILEGERRVRASVQFFRGDAQSKASRLGAVLQSSASLSMLQAAGIGLGRIGQVTDLTAVVDDSWEPRAQLEVDFQVISTEQFTLPTFGTFPLAAMLDHTAASVGDVVGEGMVTVTNVATATTRHYPVEPLDGVRTSFTFPGLPAQITGYNLYWNGLQISQGFGQNGDVLTIEEAPKLGDDFYVVY